MSFRSGIVSAFGELPNATEDKIIEGMIALFDLEPSADTRPKRRQAAAAYLVSMVRTWGKDGPRLLKERAIVDEEIDIDGS